MDKYPGDLVADIRRLQAEVAELKALLRQREGLTTASQGWIIGNRTTPPTPAGAGHLFASGGMPFWRASNGVVYNMAVQFPLAGAVADPPDFTSATDAGPTYDGATRNMINALRTDAAGTKIALDNLLSSLRAGDVIAG